MMKEQLISGRLVTFDGAGGVGKSTTVNATVDHLQRSGIPVYSARQPSTTTLGTYVRAHADTYTGMALACLVAADRHHQQATEIDPQLAAGKVVVCDRHLPSSLVLQVLDGVPAEKVWQLNEGCGGVPARRPRHHHSPPYCARRARPVRTRSRPQHRRAGEDVR
jgi:dTMP kinase